MNPPEYALTRKWASEGALYVTPGGMNDDWFWLIGGLACTAKKENRLAYIVTNDHMDDHHSQLSKNALAGNVYKRFLTWRERHWITFTFPEFWKAPPIFNFPPLYSPQPQILSPKP